MKVSKISEKIPYFRTKNIANDNNKLDPYMYVSKNCNDNYSFKGHQLQYFGGLCAIFAVIIAISKFITKNPTPRKIVELAKNSMDGLNKIQGNEKAVDTAKFDILYPLISYDSAKSNFRKRSIKHNEMHTGLIISCNNPQKAREFIQALLEHAKNKKINVQEIENTNLNNKITLAHNTLSKAIKYHNTTDKCSIAYIGNLAINTKLKACKTQPVTKLEKRLVNTKPGTLWIAWTTKNNDIPYFYNNSKTKYIVLD